MPVATSYIQLSTYENGNQACLATRTLTKGPLAQWLDHGSSRTITGSQARRAMPPGSKIMYTI